jgi:competence ComEA-like helix-hairpin-helix protein
VRVSKPAPVIAEPEPEPTQETNTPTVPAEEETAAAFAWLESLAAKQGAEEALLLKPEERLETPPAWVQEAIQADELNLTPSAEAAVKPTEEAAMPAEVTEALPDWLLEHEPEQPSEPSEASAISTAAGVIPGWLKEMETPGAPVEAASAEAALEETLPVEAPPELPSWLKEIETEPASSQPAELETWTPPPLEAIPSPAPLDLNQASLAEMERLPGVGFILAQAIVEHRERKGAFKSVDDLNQVSGLSSSTFTDIRDHFVVAAPIAVTTAPPPGVEPPASGVAGPSGKNLPEIDQARETLIQGDIQSAVDQYSALIHSRQLLPDVIRDLTEATYRYPVEAPIWQTLGDAYMRSDQLQEALDAYTKAEELLR